MYQLASPVTEWNAPGAFTRRNTTKYDTLVRALVRFLGIPFRDKIIKAIASSRTDTKLHPSRLMEPAPGSSRVPFHLEGDILVAL